MKKAFSLFELLISIVLILVVYYFVLSNTKTDKTLVSNTYQLENLKKQLSNINFEKQLEVLCIDNELECFLIKDNNLESYTKIDPLFKSIPKVYKYNKNLEQISYSRIDLKDMLSANVIFRYKINKYNKSQDIIIETKDSGVYIFNSIYNNPIKIQYLNEVYDYFTKNEKRLKDAF